VTKHFSQKLGPGGIMNLAIAVGATLILGLFYSWTSRINGVFFFGRTVSPELRASAEARAITQQYLISVAVSTAAAILCGWAAVHVGGSHYISVGPFLECIAFPFIFAKANHRVRALLLAHAEWSASTGTVREAALLEQPQYWVPGIGSILLPVVAGAIGLCAALTIAGHGAGFASAWAKLSSSMDGQGYSTILGLGTGMICASVGILVLFRTSARLRTRMAQYTVRACITLEWIAATLLIPYAVLRRLGSRDHAHRNESRPACRDCGRFRSDELEPDSGQAVRPARG